MLKHLFHGHVFAQECEVDLGPRGSAFGDAGLTAGDAGSTRRVGRGDHFFRGQVPFVAHGFLVGRGCGTGVGRGGSRR